jgi:fibronectin-binding autotransporter adhesin
LALNVGSNGGSTTYGGALEGAGSLTKAGSGTLLLTGSNTFSGTTTINQGELEVNGSLASAVTVNNGGALGGTGSLSSVLVNAGGHIAPGNSPGTLTLSDSLSLASGAVMDYELATPLTSDEVYMPTSLLSLNGQQFADFNFTPLGGFGDGTYTLIDAGSISGSLGDNVSGAINGHTATLSIEGNDLVLTVVPEPGTFGLLVGLGVGLVSFARLRRKR